MKEQLHTYPVIDAFKKKDECPFCSLERDVFQHTMDYVLGGAEGSYMQRAVRDLTDKLGFCKEHMKAMFQYGNQLGNALILQTYTEKIMDEFKKESAAFTPKKRSLFGAKGDGEESPVRWLRKRQSTCYICQEIGTTMQRYLETFFMLVKDESFRQLAEGSQGFCLRHYADLQEVAIRKLPNSQMDWYYETINRLMEENMARVQEDLGWFIQKFDYRFQDADWKNSRDAVSRTMQKINGFYPADPVYKGK